MEKYYSWRLLEKKVPNNRRNTYTSIKGEYLPDLLVFKPTFIPDPDLYEQEIQSLSSRFIETIDG